MDIAIDGSNLRIPYGTYGIIVQLRTLWAVVKKVASTSMQHMVCAENLRHWRYIFGVICWGFPSVLVHNQFSPLIVLGFLIYIVDRLLLTFSATRSRCHQP